jgi:hypothetical protein
VLLKRISGQRSTFRKSGERRCASRWASPVSMLAATIVTSTEDRSGSSAMTIVPANSRKRPRVLAIIMCRATNSICQRAGSIR